MRGEDDRMLLHSTEDRINRPVDRRYPGRGSRRPGSFSSVEERFKKSRLYVGVELQYIVFECDGREVRNTQVLYQHEFKRLIGRIEVPRKAIDQEHIEFGVGMMFPE